MKEIILNDSLVSLTTAVNRLPSIDPITFFNDNDTEELKMVSGADTKITQKKLYELSCIMLATTLWCCGITHYYLEFSD